MEITLEHSVAYLTQVGTLEYMAPEVLQKQPTTAASDVYAWAVTVNEIATGTFPFADCTKDNPQCQTVLNFGYGRSVARHMLVHYVTPTRFPRMTSVIPLAAATTAMTSPMACRRGQLEHVHTLYRSGSVQES